MPFSSPSSSEDAASPPQRQYGDGPRRVLVPANRLAANAATAIASNDAARRARALFPIGGSSSSEASPNTNSSSPKVPMRRPRVPAAASAGDDSGASLAAQLNRDVSRRLGSALLEGPPSSTSQVRSSLTRLDLARSAGRQQLQLAREREQKLKAELAKRDGFAAVGEQRSAALRQALRVAQLQRPALRIPSSPAPTPGPEARRAVASAAASSDTTAALLLLGGGGSKANQNSWRMN